MASSTKTAHYDLNVWQGSDRPSRSDFVRDNQLIDETIWTHETNMTMHLTSAEKARVSSPYAIRSVQGDDAASRTVTFDFSPQLVICFAADEPPVKTTGNVTYLNSCIAVQGQGASSGCALGGGTLTLYQTTTGDIRYNLNNSGSQYILVAFR